MALSHGEWGEIQNLIKRMIGDVGEPFVQGVVIRNDPLNGTIYLKEFGDIAIPLIAHHYSVTYNVRDTSGRIVRTKTIPYSKDVEVLVPKVGDTVLVAQHLGTRGLPKCLGVIVSRNFATGD